MTEYPGPASSCQRNMAPHRMTSCSTASFVLQLIVSHLMSDKQGLIQLTQVVHPSALSAMSRVRFHLNYIIILGQFFRARASWPASPLSAFCRHSFGLKLCRFLGLLGIHQTVNDINLFCANVPWVKIRWNLPLWGLQSIFALQNWSSIDNLHLVWPFITAQILESQYFLEREQEKNAPPANTLEYNWIWSGRRRFCSPAIRWGATKREGWVLFTRAGCVPGKTILNAGVERSGSVAAPGHQLY